MSRPEDLRLEMAVSERILGLVRMALDGELDNVNNGDLQGICEAQGKLIIDEVREAQS